MRPSGKYEVKFTGLSNGSHRFDWELDQSFFDGRDSADITDAKLKVAVDMLKSERTMELTFSIVGSVKTVCDHCGDELWLDLQAVNELIVRYAHETDLTGDEVIFLSYDAHVLDLGQFIYEYIRLAVPVRKLHPTGECNPEVEHYFDQNTGTKKENEKDPRWKALEKLKNQS